MGGLGHGHGHQHENITIDWDRCLPTPYLCSRPEILVESWTLKHYLAPILSTFYNYIFWKNNSSFQHKMGRADPRGKMELRTLEDAPKACRACGDACRDDSHPPCCPCCITGWNIDIFSSASDSLMTSRLFLYSGKSEDHLLTIFVLW